MNTRALLAALLFGGAVMGTRVLPGQTITQQPVASHAPLSDAARCTAASGTERQHRRQKPSGVAFDAPRTSCPRPAMLALGSG